MHFQLGRGFVGKWYTRPDIILDLIPVDHVVNAIIAGAWRRANIHRNECDFASTTGAKRANGADCDRGEPVIYHVSSSQQNPFTIKQLGEVLNVIYVLLYIRKGKLDY